MNYAQIDTRGEGSLGFFVFFFFPLNCGSKKLSLDLCPKRLSRRARATHDEEMMESHLESQVEK